MTSGCHRLQRCWRPCPFLQQYFEMVGACQLQAAQGISFVVSPIPSSSPIPSPKILLRHVSFVRMSFSEPTLSKPIPTQILQPYPQATTTSSDSIASHEYNACLPRIKSITKHSGFSVATWFKAFFQIVIALSTLGTSVTFNYVLSDVKEPKYLWTKPQIQVYLSISWVLFLLALAFASLASTLLNFFQGHAVRDWDGDDRKRKRILQSYATITSLLLYGLVIAAFTVIGVVVTAYSFVVGWVAVGFTAVFGVGGLLCILIQSPLCTS